MNLNLQLVSIALGIFALVTLSSADGQSLMVPAHAVPASFTGQSVVQQFDHQGIQQAVSQPPAWGFTQYMNERHLNLDAQVDYTPELIGTYDTTSDCKTASRIGVATVTDYALGQGKHSPLVSNIGQASYFHPVGQQEPFASDVVPGVGVAGYSVDGSPRIFGDTNIGGGRSIAKAFIDPHWTRMVLIYGGFGNSTDSSGDVFGGQASTNLGVVGVDIGRRHSRFMRSSIDFAYRGGNVSFGGAEAGQLRIYSLMKNFHLDLAQRGRFRPYAGVGIGAGVLDSDVNFGGDTFSIQDEVSFAYQVIGGLAHNISDLAAIYAEYRFFSMSDVDVVSSTGPQEGGFSSHDVLFGLRFGY